MASAFLDARLCCLSDACFLSLPCACGMAKGPDSANVSIEVLGNAWQDLSAQIAATQDRPLRHMQRDRRV